MLYVAIRTPTSMAGFLRKMVFGGTRKVKKLKVPLASTQAISAGLKEWSALSTEFVALADFNDCLYQGQRTISSTCSYIRCDYNQTTTTAGSLLFTPDVTVIPKMYAMYIRALMV